MRESLKFSIITRVVLLSINAGLLAVLGRWQMGGPAVATAGVCALTFVSLIVDVSDAPGPK